MRLFHHEIREKIEERVANPAICRLLRRWYRLKPDDSSVPDISGFSQDEIAWCWDCVMVLRQLDGSDDFAYDHYGDAVADAAGFNLAGKKVSDFKSPVGAFFREKYVESLEHCLPLYTVHRAELSDRVQSWERLILPIKGDGDAWFLVVYNQPLEFKFELLDSVLRASMDGIFYLRARRGAGGDIDDFAFSVVNPAAERIAGVPEAKLIDRTLTSLPPNNILHGLEPACREVMDLGRSTSYEYEDPRPGRYAIYQINAVRVGDGVTVTMANISSLKRQEKELRTALDSLENEVRERKNLQDELTRMATTDPLTGALNRRELLQRAKRETALAGRYKRSLSLIIADIDLFKRVNDTYGHAAGDVAIKLVSDIFRRTLRASDLVARIGGEEYVLLMPETPLNRALATAERLRKTIEGSPVTSDQTRFQITASFGVTEWQPDDASIEVTMARADAALYQAKETGRNKVIGKRSDDQDSVAPEGVDYDTGPSASRLPAEAKGIIQF